MSPTGPRNELAERAPLKLTARIRPPGTATSSFRTQRANEEPIVPRWLLSNGTIYHQRTCTADIRTPYIIMALDNKLLRPKTRWRATVSENVDANSSAGARDWMGGAAPGADKTRQYLYLLSAKIGAAVQKDPWTAKPVSPNRGDSAIPSSKCSAAGAAGA